MRELSLVMPEGSWLRTDLGLGHGARAPAA